MQVSLRHAADVIGAFAQLHCFPSRHPPLSRGMPRVGYLFERFPSVGQNFCYREVAEMIRQGVEVSIFSIRRPADEPAENWDREIIERVVYLPDESRLVAEIERVRPELPKAAINWIKDWDRRTDFLRLYQAAYVGLRLREARISHVHVHFVGMAARTAYWIREFFGIDFSLTAHANDIFAPREFAIGLPKLFAAASAVVTVSDFAVAYLQEKFAAQAAKFHRVYNGVDVEQFEPANFAAEVPLILSVGRLIEKKGFADLARACAVMRERGLHFRCEIIGEGPLSESLRAEPALKLCGAKTQREIAQRLAAANVFVLPCIVDAKGDTDNLPTVIMEAMAAGLPVVSTRLAGIPEMVESGENGELVMPSDVPQLANAIERLLTNRERAREFGARGREIAAEKFSLTKNVARLRDVLGLK